MMISMPSLCEFVAVVVPFVCLFDFQCDDAQPNYTKFADDFPNHLEGFRRVFDSLEPHRVIEN